MDDLQLQLIEIYEYLLTLKAGGVKCGVVAGRRAMCARDLYA